MVTFPDGLLGFDHMPYGYRRWNGSVWADIQIDRYNQEIDRIQRRHEFGMSTKDLIDGLYNLAYGFDHVEGDVYHGLTSKAPRD